MYGNLSEEKKPLLHYSEHSERAQLVDDIDKGEKDSLKTTKKRKSGKKKSVEKGKRKVLRVAHGNFSIKVPGFPGLQKFSASQILPLIPVSQLRAAAKRVLSQSGKKKNRKKKKKKRETRR